MRDFRQILALCICIALSACGPKAVDNSAIFAVATNFVETARALEARYEAASGQQIILVSGSTGKLYTQIKQGAPYDGLLSADQARPARLITEGDAVAGSQFTYAQGQLALWWTRDEPPDQSALIAAEAGQTLALANPELAPYGAAAMAVLDTVFGEAGFSGKIVMGENIGQAFTMVATGNADLGLVARASLPAVADGTHWTIPQTLYPPIKQDAVLLVAGKDKPAAQGFLDFLKSDAGRAVISARGYEAPQ